MLVLGFCSSKEQLGVSKSLSTDKRLAAWELQCEPVVKRKGLAGGDLPHIWEEPRPPGQLGWGERTCAGG